MSRLNLIVIFILCILALVGCGKQKSSLQAILGEKPNWVGISKTDSPLIKNLFQIQFQNKTLGMGFFYSSDSRILITNAHVAVIINLLCRSKCNEVKISGHSGELGVIEVQSLDKDLDVAFIKVKWTRKLEAPLTLKIGKQLPSKGVSMTILSFLPEGKELIRSSGQVMETSYSRGEKPYFSYNADTLPGMSGSPVFNDHNELMGLHFGYLKVSKSNRAIPIRLIKEKYPDFFE